MVLGFHDRWSVDGHAQNDHRLTTALQTDINTLQHCLENSGSILLFISLLFLMAVFYFALLFVLLWLYYCYSFVCLFLKSMIVQASKILQSQSIQTS